MSLLNNKEKLIVRASLIDNEFKRPKYQEEIDRLVNDSIIYNYDENPDMFAEHDPDLTVLKPGWRSFKHTLIRVNDAPARSDIVTCAMKHTDGKIAVLNFASPKTPGGKFKEGSSAQEEYLCHNSMLYPVLCGLPEHYKYNKKHLNGGIYPHTMIYSPNIPFYRFKFSKDTKGNVIVKLTPYIHGIVCDPANDNRIDPNMLMNNTELVADVITCAAPNFKHILSKCDHKDLKETLFQAFEAMRMRIHYVFRTAFAHGVSDIVLGAWGCGVYGWDAAFVAPLFRYEIEQFWMCQFRTISFAIPRMAKSDISNYNHNAFKVVMSIEPQEASDVDLYYKTLNGKLSKDIANIFVEYMDSLTKTSVFLRRKVELSSVYGTMGVK